MSTRRADCALVTGGSRGIGRATALALAGAGVTRIALGFVDNEAAAQDACRAVESAGAEAVAIRANLATPTGVDQLFDGVAARFGALDVFVHCAAIAAFKPLSQTRPNQWDITMNTNARSFLAGAQRAIPMMSDGGSMVAVSSLGSVRAFPNYGAMGPTKAALESIVRGLAVELAPRRVRVNAVSAGLVNGTGVTALPGSAAAIAAASKRTPMGRIAEPEEIASIIVFLCAPASHWITGQTLIADGGWSLV